MIGFPGIGTALAILLSAGAAGDDTCDTIWNAEYRYRLAQSDIVVKTDRFIGYPTRDELVAMAAASAEGDPRAIERAMSTVAHGEDCDGDGVIDAYRHIYLDGAPVGFTSEEWAGVRELRSDPFYNR